MKRREFIAFLGGAASLPVSAGLSRAQTPKTLRVGSAGAGASEPTYAVTTGSFLKRMAELGYERGRNLVLEHVPLSKRTEDEYNFAYQEVAARNVDIFLVIGLEIALKAAVAAAGKKPIVMVAINWDP